MYLVDETEIREAGVAGSESERVPEEEKPRRGKRREKMIERERECDREYLQREKVEEV